MSNKPLPKTQSELLEAMQRGVKCYYMPYSGCYRPHDYYFRSDNMKHCTAAAKALLEKGLVVVVDRTFSGHSLVAKEMPNE